MKALVLAAALAALSSSAPGSAARDVHTQHLPKATGSSVVMADAGHLGSTSLTALNGSPWSTTHGTEAEGVFDTAVLDVDTGTLLLGISVVVFIASRPLARALRRQEQQRRATALASTLSHPQR